MINCEQVLRKDTGMSKNFIYFFEFIFFQLDCIFIICRNEILDESQHY